MLSDAQRTSNWHSSALRHEGREGVLSASHSQVDRFLEADQVMALSASVSLLCCTILPNQRVCHDPKTHTLLHHFDLEIDGTISTHPCNQAVQWGRGCDCDCFVSPEFSMAIFLIFSERRILGGVRGVQHRLRMKGTLPLWLLVSFWHEKSNN